MPYLAPKPRVGHPWFISTRAFLMEKNEDHYSSALLYKGDTILTGKVILLYFNSVRVEFDCNDTAASVP